MSFSVYSNRTPVSDLRSVVASKLEDVPEGPGRDEATKAAPVIDAALEVLAADLEVDEIAVSVSGSGSPSTAMLSINLQPAHD